MKQKLLFRRVLSCLLLIAFSVSSWADVEESVVDGIKYRFDTIYKVASVISNNYKGSVTIPSEVEYNGRQYVVKYIRKKAFSECFSLSSVSIPESVTSIGDSAFGYRILIWKETVV